MFRFRNIFKTIVMYKKIKILAIQLMIMGLSFILINSCTDDNQGSGQTFRIVISSDYIVQNYQLWIVVSDDETVLMSEKLENGHTYEVTDVTAKLVDVHIFQYYEVLPTQRLYVYTYNDVPLAEWNKRIQYPSSFLGTITVSVSDLVNIKNLTVSASRSSISSSSTTLKTINAYVNPENILISYLPSDNSALRYKYVQNVVPAGQTLTYIMSDFQAATGLISYSLPSYSYLSYTMYGYFTNQNIGKYRLGSYYYYDSSISTLNFYYPSGLFPNYHSSFYIEDPSDVTRGMSAIKYGALPTVLPAVSYADITLTNEDDIDMVTASITDFQNYQEFDFKYSVSQSPQYFEWNVMNKASSTISTSLPDIPEEIKQKSTFFSKSNLNFSLANLYKYLSGTATTYDDFISQSIKPSVAFNEVVTEYNVYYKFPSAGKKGGEMEREHKIPEPVSGEGIYSLR